MRWLLTVIFLSLVAACGAGDTTDDPNPNPLTTTPRTTDQPVATPSRTAPVPTTQTSVTTAATTTAPTTTTAAPATTTTVLQVEIELGTDGLGDLVFGDATTVVVEVLTDLLGPPTPGDEYPYGAHPLRHLYWENVGLAVVFSDYAFFRDDGVEHLAGWAHGPYVGDLAGSSYAATSWPLRTAAGVGIDSTLADLQATYGDRLVLEAACDPGGPPTEAYVRGRLSSMRFLFGELPLSAASQVIAMTAGAGPGC